MYATLADIRNDCEFQDDHIVQGHAVIFKFFCRSLRTECPLLPSYLSPLPSSNATAQRKFLSPCELRFSEKKLDVPDVCWPAKRNLDNLWAGLSGPPADFAIGIKNVFYRRVVGFGRHTDPRRLPRPRAIRCWKKLLADSRVPEWFSASLSLRCQWQTSRPYLALSVS